MRVSYLGSSESSFFIQSDSVRISLLDDVVIKNSVNSLTNTDSAYEKSRFYVRVQDEQFSIEGIYSRDVLVVDRSVAAHNCDFVIACIEGEMRVVLLEIERNALVRPKNKAYKALDVSIAANLDILGVVTGLIRGADTHGQVV